MGEQTNPLDALRDIHTPASIGWWPPAPGWWLVLALLIISVVALVYWLKRKPTRQQPAINYRQVALTELQQIEDNLQQSNNEQQFITALSLLMKRYTHAYYPDAATLTGHAWLAFLDQSIGEQRFQEFHQQLCIAPYTNTAIERKEELIELVSNWIQQLPQHSQQRKT